MAQKGSADDAAAIRLYFYEPIANASAVGEAQSAARQQKILRQEQVQHEVNNGERDSFANGVELGSIEISSNPMSSSKVLDSFDKRHIKRNCGIKPGWQKGLVSESNNGAKFHAELYKGVVQANATGVSLSKIRVEAVNRGNTYARNI